MFHNVVLHANMKELDELLSDEYIYVFYLSFASLAVSCALLYIELIILLIVVRQVCVRCPLGGCKQASGPAGANGQVVAQKSNLAAMLRRSASASASASA